ncbi:MAG TPA: hypothetical protein VHC69_33835 [Polyangiaceae bacterium]|nr:hypothetical protein [Polyangiaceae bacterium]
MTEQTDPSASALAQPSGSVLSEAEVRTRGIVLDAREGPSGGWRDCSYDLGVKYVIDSKGDDHELKPDQFFEIQPHGMVEVIASERVRLPDDVVGYAMVKTGLTIEGIFALNIGIIDPAYDGHISTTLINFSKRKYQLRSGDPFLRLTFHRLATPATRKPPPVSFHDYLAIRKTKAEKHFSETFLDMEGTAKAVSTELLGEWKKNLFIWIPAIGFVLAVLTLLFNMAALVLNLTASNRHSVTDADVHNICEDVARSLGKQQQMALTPGQLASICSNPIATSNSPSTTAPLQSAPTAPSTSTAAPLRRAPTTAP